jgi:hypothetical protein
MQIDEQLLTHAASYRAIARQYQLTHRSLQRHEQTHLHSSLKLVQARGIMLSADTMTEKLAEWHHRMEEQYSKADTTNNILAAVATARTGIAAIDSFAKLTVLSDLEQRLQALEADKETDGDA